MLFLIIFSISQLTYNTAGMKYSFILPAGKFTFECYGGQGGNSTFDGKERKAGGKGAYVKGVLTIKGEPKTFYAHVGGLGEKGELGPNEGGSNGGGNGGKDTGNSWLDANDAPGGGGGASDIRYKYDNYYNRVMVAAGGSGAAYMCDGAPGGDLYGYKPTSNDIFVQDTKVSQDSDRVLGEGENGDNHDRIPSSGAGGGWRGGYKGESGDHGEDKSYKAVSSSGSSYVSGHTGCTKNGEIVFTNTEMKKGNHTGVGKIVITVQFNCSQNCYSCTSATFCSECNTGYLKQDGVCVTKCSSGYIKVGSICSKCASHCLACSTATSACTKCEDGYFLNGVQCSSSCSKGYYANTANKKCEKCDDTCASCESSPTNCLSCVNNYILYDNSCLTKCPERTTRNGTNCEPCHSSCKTCSSDPSECTSCETGFYLHQGNCVDECPEKFFANKGHCSDCKAPCESCDSKEHCITCVEGFNLTDGKCVI